MHDDPALTTPIGLARYAHDFLDSSRAINDHYGKNDGFEIVSPVPALYLIGHSIELAFKSYLLHRDITLRELRSKKFGHDLHYCQSKAKELGLSASIKFHPAEEGAVELLNTLERQQGTDHGYARKTTQLTIDLSGTPHVQVRMGLAEGNEQFAKAWRIVRRSRQCICRRSSANFCRHRSL